MNLKDVKFNHESNNLNSILLYFEPSDELSSNDAKVETEKFTDAIDNIVRNHYSSHDFVFSRSTTGKYTDDCLGFVNNRFDYCLKSPSGEIFRTSISNSVKLSSNVDCVNFVKFSSYGTREDLLLNLYSSIKDIPELSIIENAQINIDSI